MTKENGDIKITKCAIVQIVAFNTFILFSVFCDIVLTYSNTCVSGKLTEYQEVQERATDLLMHLIPSYFDNTTDYYSLTFHKLIERIDDQSQFITNETVFYVSTVCYTT